MAIAGILLLLVGVPLMMYVWMRALYGEKRRSRGVAAIGAALQELDRLVTRPSVVHKVESEHKVVESDNDAGGK